MKVIPVAAAIFAALACSDTLAPFQPEITNVTDNFQFQATALTNVTTTVQYTWQNSSTAATVNHSSAVTGGTAVLTVKDANGTTVYSGALVASGTPSTSTGVAGAWSIQVGLVNVSGTLNFRVQKL
jgi:hypothetical protein